MYILTIVQKNTAGETASSTFTFDSKKAALEKLYYEMYYACNQNLPYVLVILMDENCAIHKTETFKGETEIKITEE